MRQRKLTAEAMIADCQGARGTNVDYIAILQRYDEMPDDKRLLVYYEDLMVDPAPVLGMVFMFLEKFNYKPVGRFSEPMVDFLNGIDWHHERSRKLYNNGFEHTPCETTGELIHHSKKLPVEEVQKIDEYLEVTYPDIFQKYLMRYI